MIACAESLAGLLSPFGQSTQSQPYTVGFTIYGVAGDNAAMPAQFTLPITHCGTERKTLDVLDEMLVSKRGANRREIYIKSLRYFLTRFAQQNPLLTQTTTADVEKWLAKWHNVQYRATWLTRIETLFSFACKRDYLAKNPCDKIERPTIEKRVPKIFTPAEARTAYRSCPRGSRAWVVLCLWCGLRPSEAARILWEDINLEQGTVTVRVSKVRRYRIVKMPECAVELLRPLAKSSGAIAQHQTTLRRALKYMRRGLKLERWPQDIMRHTAASYHLAMTGDAGKVATMLGNSPQILLTHYNGVATLDDAQEFFKVTTPPPAPHMLPLPKYDHTAVRAFYEGCNSYKKTCEHFGISNSSTLHYILTIGKCATNTPPQT
jgi:integrase